MEVCSASWECRARAPASEDKLEKASGRRGSSIFKVQSVLAAKETEEHKEKMLSSGNLEAGFSLLTCCRARQTRNTPSFWTKPFLILLLECVIYSGSFECGQDWLGLEKTLKEIGGWTVRAAGSWAGMQLSK